jgi:hypothetical protein
LVRFIVFYLCVIGYYNSAQFTDVSLLGFSVSVGAAIQVTTDSTTSYPVDYIGGIRYGMDANYAINGHTGTNFKSTSPPNQQGSKTVSDTTAWKWWQVDLTKTITFGFDNLGTDYIIWNVTVTTRTDSGLTEISGFGVWIGNTSQTAGSTFGVPQGGNPSTLSVTSLNGWIRCNTNEIVVSSNPVNIVNCGGKRARYVAVVLPNTASSSGGSYSRALQIAQVQVTVQQYKQSGFATCDPCSSGFYTTALGSTACVSCEQGKYSPIGGSPECIKCPAGSYNPSNGQSACTLCAKGQFYSDTGALACSPCAIGQVASSIGSTLCITCPAGKSYQKRVILLLALLIPILTFFIK